MTKGNFTRDEWNHLLRLFNVMIFSVFSCRLFKSIIKSKIMSKRPHEGKLREEDRVVVESKPMMSSVLKSVNRCIRVQIVPATGTKTPSQALCPAVHSKCLFHTTSSSCRSGGKPAFSPHAYIHSTACVLRPDSWLPSTLSPYRLPARDVLAGTPLTTTPVRSRRSRSPGPIRAASPVPPPRR